MFGELEHQLQGMFRYIGEHGVHGESYVVRIWAHRGENVVIRSLSTPSNLA